jgi:flagellin-like hook-associated protein FlgL
MDAISLTSGMRDNLVNLQNTATLTSQTQERLSTGKKVNSALDNPTEFFASQNMLNQAASLSSLSDGMSNAVQMIQAANKGITAITGLLNSAQAIAQSAIGLAGNSNADLTVSLTSNFVVGDSITVGGVAFTATATAGTAKTFVVGSDASTTATNIATAINAASVDTTTPKSVTATSTGSVLTISAASDFAKTDATITQKTANTGAAATIALDTQKQQLATQYATVMNQIDLAAGAAGFQGIDLLTSGTKAGITVQFGTATGDNLTVDGTSADSATLMGGSAAITSSWGTDANVNTDIANITSAISTLQSFSSNLSSNLSTISIRQQFSTDMQNVLQTGSDNLTNADTNQEGANMLMLQTRQSLGTTALSLASQSAQAVLKLFG